MSLGTGTGCPRPAGLASGVVTPLTVIIPAVGNAGAVLAGPGTVVIGAWITVPADAAPAASATPT